MAIKKSELYSSIWESCDELRGGMDASQYKDYILTLLFVKYVSDKFIGDKDALVVVPVGGSFSDMVKLKGKPDIGEGIDKILAKLAEENGLKGVIDSASFNDEDKLGKGKEMVDRLSQLVAIFENPELNFSNNRADGDDILGDAYEYLMKHFATESGKSKGQFYTPAEVSRVIAQLIKAYEAKDQSCSVYDPTCGSGSLLLKVAAATPSGITIYGQEKDSPTAALAVMNMWLHNNPQADIRKGQSTLSNPLHLDRDGSLQTFDYVVANPPFSYKSWRSGFNPEHDEYDRFTGYGVPPAKNGDFAFLLHIIRSLKSTGTGAVVLPHGVLFRGNAEGEIRKNIIKKGYIKAVVGLPTNLFYGTGIPACIVVIDKKEAGSRNSIFMIDASKSFVKDGNKNRLREQDIHKIIDAFTKQLEIPKYSRLVPITEIEEKEYNLNIPRYIDSQEEEDIQDIEAHLLGDIPDKDIKALSKYWDVYPNLKTVLLSKSTRTNYSKLLVEDVDVKKTIYSHKEFEKYSKEILVVFNNWKLKNTPVLKNIGVGDKPKEIINQISEDLIENFSNLKLIDKYDVYQSLMNYWNAVMQDDMYLIVTNGWNAEISAVLNTKGKEVGWESPLLPKELVINRYFIEEKNNIQNYQDKLDEVNSKMEELTEEHSGEEGLLEEVKTESGNITKSNILARIKEINNDPTFSDELTVLNEYLKLLEKETAVKKGRKSLESELDKKLFDKYHKLTEEEVKQLVVDDKWMGTLEQLVQSEMDRISQRLTQRIKELAKRYQNTLPELDKEVKDLAQKIEEHLKKMGFSW